MGSPKTPYFPDRPFHKSAQTLSAKRGTKTLCSPSFLPLNSENRHRKVGRCFLFPIAALASRCLPCGSPRKAAAEVGLRTSAAEGARTTHGLATVVDGGRANDPSVFRAARTVAAPETVAKRLRDEQGAG